MRIKYFLIFTTIICFICGCENQDQTSKSPEEILEAAEIKYDQYLTFELLDQPSRCLIFYRVQNTVVGALMAFENNGWKKIESIHLNADNVDRMSWNFKNFGKYEYQSFSGLILDREIQQVNLQLSDTVVPAKIVVINDNLKLWYAMKQEVTKYQSDYHIIALSAEGEELIRFK